MSKCFLPKLLYCCEDKLHFEYMIELAEVQFTHLWCSKSTVVINVVLLKLFPIFWVSWTYCILKSVSICVIRWTWNLYIWSQGGGTVKSDSEVHDSVKGMQWRTKFKGIALVTVSLCCQKTELVFWSLLLSHIVKQIWMEMHVDVM
jgi:hypothetical protein